MAQVEFMGHATAIVGGKTGSRGRKQPPSSSSSSSHRSVAAYDHGSRLSCFLPRRRFAASAWSDDKKRSSGSGSGWIRMRTLRLQLRRNKKPKRRDSKKAKRCTSSSSVGTNQKLKNQTNPTARDHPKHMARSVEVALVPARCGQHALRTQNANQTAPEESDVHVAVEIQLVEEPHTEEDEEFDDEEEEDDDVEEEADEEEEEVVMVDQGEHEREDDDKSQRDHPMCRCLVKRSCCSFDGDHKPVHEWLATWTQRERKWMAKFESKDWQMDPRVCQKWKHATELDDSMATATTTDDSDANDSATEPSSSGVTFRVKTGISNFASAAESLMQARQFETLIRSGVPCQIRGRVWWLCSDAERKKQKGPESYATLVQRAQLGDGSGCLNDRVAAEIEKDLHRTFPRDNSSSQESARIEQNTNELRRVLRAYSLRNPSVGYCQSMNFLVAVLLNFLEEEETFWVLSSLIEDLIPQFHSCSMSGSRGEQRVLMELLEAKMPDVAHHLQTLGVQMEPLTLKWFLCLYLNSLPLECVLRIWDVFFHEGSHVLLRVGLVLMKLMRPQLLACEEAFDVYELLRFSCQSLKQLLAPFRNGILNRKDEVLADTLIRLAMEKSFLGPIAMDSLQELRRFHQNNVQLEFEQDEKERKRHLEARQSSHKQESNESTGSSEEYDLVDEFLESPQCEISPLRYIRFCDLYDDECADSDEGFVDVKFDRRPGGVRSHR